MEGYSGTPLAKKLGIKSKFNILLVNAPKHYKALFSDFPNDVLEVTKPNKELVDFIHIFCLTQNDLETHLTNLKSFLRKDGMIWVSWPKGTSKIKTELNREIIRDYMLSKIKLVDIKVAAIDADWSGLKFVFRKEDR